LILKILHIFVLLNLLVSSFGLKVNEHVCKIKGKSFSLFIKKESCCSEKKSNSCTATSCPQHKEASSIKRKGCCENKLHYGKLSVEANLLNKVEFAKTTTHFSSNIKWPSFDTVYTQIINEKILRYFVYDPPHLFKGSLRILFQSFLC